MDTIDTMSLFELELELPDVRLEARAKRLVGFDTRYSRLHRTLRLLVDAEGIEVWSRRLYSRRVPLADLVADRYPLVIFHGDVGTGKTETAEAAASRLAKEMRREGRLFKLSTRVRGSGHVGQMSTLINKAFEVIEKEAGKRRLVFLIVDEGDSLAASRDQHQSHHEDKVGVNTLIQRIDAVRRFGRESGGNPLHQSVRRGRPCCAAPGWRSGALRATHGRRAPRAGTHGPRRSGLLGRGAVGLRPPYRWSRGRPARSGTPSLTCGLGCCQRRWRERSPTDASRSTMCSERFARLRLRQVWVRMVMAPSETRGCDEAGGAAVPHRGQRSRGGTARIP